MVGGGGLFCGDRDGQRGGDGGEIWEGWDFDSLGMLYFYVLFPCYR